MNISLFNKAPRKNREALKRDLLDMVIGGGRERHVRELVTSGDIEFILNFITDKKSLEHRHIVNERCTSGRKEEGALTAQRERTWPEMGK